MVPPSEIGREMPESSHICSKWLFSRIQCGFALLICRSLSADRGNRTTHPGRSGRPQRRATGTPKGETSLRSGVCLERCTQRLPELNAVSLRVGEPAELAVVVVGVPLGIDFHSSCGHSVHKTVEVVDAEIQHGPLAARAEVIGIFREKGQ